MNEILRKVTTSSFGRLVHDKGPRIAVIGGVATMLGSGVHAVVKTPAFYEEYKRLDAECAPIRDKAKLVLKTYAGDVIFAGLGAASVIGFDGLTNKRVTEWIAAYKALDVSYEELLKRFEEHVGDDKLEEILYDVHEEEDGDGEKRLVGSKEAKVMLSPFSRFYDEANPNWDNRNPMYNRNFLKQQLESWNTILGIRADYKDGVTANEVLESLGYEKVFEGDRMGWNRFYYPNDAISFGIEDHLDDPTKRAFYLGDEPSVIITLNCHYIGDTFSRDAEFLPNIWKRIDGFVHID